MHAPSQAVLFGFFNPSLLWLAVAKYLGHPIEQVLRELQKPWHQIPRTDRTMNSLIRDVDMEK